MRHLVLGVLVALLSAAPAAGAGSYAYVTGTGNFDLNVIDTSTHELASPITVGATTRGVAVDPSGARIYVASSNGSPGRLYAIDAKDPTKSSSVAVGASPFGVAAVAIPNGTRVFVAHRGTGKSGFLSVVDVSSTGTMSVVGSPLIVGGAPTGVAVTQDGSRVYVANSLGRIAAVDVTPAGVASIAAMAFPGGGLVGIAVSPNGDRVYAANHAGNNLFVLETSTLTNPSPSISSVTVGNNPYGVAVSKNGRIYVANYGSNSLSIVENGVSTQTVDVGRQPLGVAVSSDGSRVYVVNSSLLVSQERPSVTVLTGTGGFIKTVDLLLKSFPVGLGAFLAGSGLIKVEIDIRPASINTKSQGTVPVILFGSAEFNVSSVNLETVRLGGAPVAVRGNGPMMQYGDWNNDGLLDMMLHVESEMIQAGTVRAMDSGDPGLALEGQTNDGVSFEGTDAVRVK